MPFYGSRINLANPDAGKLELFCLSGRLVDALGFLLAAGGLLTASYSRSLYYSMILRFNPVLGIAIPFLLNYIFILFI
jgi:hypothetical protein